MPQSQPKQQQELTNVSKPNKRKNLIVISLSWVFLFIGFFSISNLQSSLNSDANLGTTCLSVIYVSLIVGSSFFPKLLVKSLGLKKTIVVAQIGYLIYLSANVYASWFTLLPASILLGFASCALWVAKNLYINEIYLSETTTSTNDNVNKISQTSRANDKGNLRGEDIPLRSTDEPKDNSKIETSATTSKVKRQNDGSGKDSTITLNQFMSIFFGFFLSSQIWANLLSSLILRPDVPENAPTVNYSMPANTSRYSYCGASGCPWHENEVPLVKPKMESVYLLIGVLAASTVVSILINAIFLENIEQTINKPTRNETDNRKQSENPVRKFLKQLISGYQLLITPFSLWIGFVHGFMAADFTKYYVACMFGVHKVGFYVMFYGIFLTIGCTLNAVLVKYIGRIGSIVIGMILYFPTLFLMLFWQNPNPELYSMLFVLASFMGVAVSFWEPNVNAAIGIIFENSCKNEAFSIFKLWESVGFFVAFLYSSYVCVWFKICVLIGIGAMSIIGFFAIEFLRKKQNKNNNSNDQRNQNNANNS